MKCADPRTLDPRGRRCVAFEFSIPSKTTVKSRSRCAFAWGCDFTKYWRGGSVWKPTIPLTPMPTVNPSEQPTSKPTNLPTNYPTANPTFAPTKNPTDNPTKVPTMQPTPIPTRSPTKACLIARSGREWCQDTRSQCFVNQKQYNNDRLDNPMFNGGGFWSYSTTMEECAMKCADPRTLDPRGRRCVAFEFSIPSKTTVKSRSRCAFAWGCDYTKNWSGGSVWRPTKACLITRSGRKWCQDTKSQCFVSATQYKNDRLDNPMFNGGGFWSKSTTMEECARKCADPTNVDPKGRRCVAFEFSIPSKTNLKSRSRCAFAWGCHYTKYWRGGSVWKPTNPKGMETAL